MNAEKLDDRVGRVWRDGYKLYVGGEVRDFDELRSCNQDQQLLPAVRALDPPITAPELVWLMVLTGILDNYPGTRNAFILGVAEDFRKRGLMT